MTCKKFEGVSEKYKDIVDDVSQRIGKLSDISRYWREVVIDGG